MKCSILTMEGPEWTEVLGVFVGGSHAVRAITVQQQLIKGEQQHRIPPPYRTPTFIGLSRFHVRTREAE